MKAEALAQAILMAINNGEVNPDAEIDVAEELIPGSYHFLGGVDLVTTLPPHGKTVLFLVNKAECCDCCEG